MTSQRFNKTIERKKEIIKAAMQLFSEKGYAQTSMRDIARTMGVSLGLCYRYFDSKQILFNTAIDLYIEECCNSYLAILHDSTITIKDKIDALFTSAAVGMIIGMNATLSGAEGGCQAECGSASAMAAAAVVEMMGGTPKMCLDAAAIVLKNILGLVCDPVAGLVEIPCAKRNAAGAVSALSTAELVMAGVSSHIPFDDAITAMYQVGKSLPSELRETALGGVAITKAGLVLKKKVFGDEQ